jgi:hypothetical protein
MSREKQNVRDHHRADITVATVWLIFYVIIVGTIAGAAASVLTISDAIELGAR